jgi:glyoxylase-like metal-dependent hydrolase (beta-lactamase superfamily II)
MEEGTRLVIHALDERMLSDPEINAGMGFLRKSITAPAPTDRVKEGDELTIAGLTIKVLHTPGHTPGSVCYLIENELFTGDTLFDNGWGRTDLPGGNEHEMARSLRRLVPMMREYGIHAGH